MLQNTRFFPRGTSIALLAIVAACGVMPLRLVAAAPEPAPQHANERMSVNFQDIDVRTLLQVMASSGQRKIVIADSVKGTVTLRMDDAPWDQLLDAALSSAGLAKRVQGDVIYVSPAP